MESCAFVSVFSHFSLYEFILLQSYRFPFTHKSHLSFSHIFNLANSLNSAARNFRDTQILTSKILRTNVLKKFHRLFFAP